MRLNLFVLTTAFSSLLLCSSVQAQEPFKSRIEIADATPYKAVYQVSEYRPQQARIHKVASSSGNTEFYFSDYIDDIPEQSEQGAFDCVGGIYAVLKFPASDHNLRNMKMVVEWINPAGDLELTDEQAKYAEQNGTAYRWGGMILKRPQGGGLFSLLDHSAGMERFIGKWQVNVILDGLRLPTQSLRVEC